MARNTVDVPDGIVDGNDENWPQKDINLDREPLPDASALELLAQAEGEYTAGQDRQWAGTLLAALRIAYLDLAEAKRIKTRKIEHIAIALDGLDYSDRIRHYRGNLSNADMLSYHHQTGAVPDYWHEGLYKDTVKFIKACYDPAS